MKKILVPVDGSPTSLKAALKAVEVAKKYDSELIFMTVARVPEKIISTGDSGLASSGYGAYDLEKIGVELKENQSRILDHSIQYLDLEGVKWEKKMAEGFPSEEIVDMANELGVDLIVIGRRGYSRIKRFFTGSVSNRVISEAHCPVLVINDDQAD